MKRMAALTLFTGALLMTTLAPIGAAPNAGSTVKKPWGKTPDGQAVDLYVLTNRAGMEMAITTYGGAVVSLKTPDRSGKLGDVVLGYDSLEGYVNDKAYLGAIVGRYGNRIAHAQFSLDGKTYTLAKNNGENSLHGGIKGFNKAVWTAKEISTRGGPSLELSYLSKDGEEGFAGNLKVTVTYLLLDNNALRIEYSATTDKKTVVNLTNHSYFNLAGPGGDILSTVLMVEADKFTPVDAGLIPTGELRDVSGTPFDFRKPTAIGARIEQDDEQLKLGHGYDHNFVLRRAAGERAETLAARAVDPASGRVLEVWTTEPGVQLYTSNFLDGVKGKGGVTYTRRSAFCLETQHFPDSPNQAKFPSAVLSPGETYHTSTTFKFTVEK